MATDIQAIVDNVRDFHDVREKSVLHVGAGGGQFIAYTADARSVLAVDSDPDATARLIEVIQGLGIADRVRATQGDFLSVSERADLVFFEFCLHEMNDPDEALRHARSLAPEILVVDHHPESEWAWHTCEEEKAARSWASARQLRVADEVSFRAKQQFDSYHELLSKVQVLGAKAIERSRKFSGQRTIELDMQYSMALLHERPKGNGEST